VCRYVKSFSFWGWGTLSPRLPARAMPLDPTGRQGLLSPEPPDWPMFILGLFGGNPQKIQNPKKFDETEEPEARNHGWMTLTKILVPIAFTV